MAILIDISGILNASLFQTMKLGKMKKTQFAADEDENPFSVDMLRHMVLNSIRLYRTKFQREYGEVVLCCDSGNVWRKKFFPYYKQCRKDSRESSLIPWDEVFPAFQQILKEIDESFPYKVIKIDTMEADDIIAAIAAEAGRQEKLMIISSDKDLIQLQMYENVKQFSPSVKTEIMEADPLCYLVEQIFKGDTGDGVPNVLSDDDTFIMKDKRQGRMTQKRLDELKCCPEHKMDTITRRNYIRNKKLIDLREVPQDLQTKALEAFHKPKERNNQSIMKYFVTHRMKNLMSNRGEF